MKKILTIVGARPHFMKSIMLSKVLNTSKFKEILVHTGQHYDTNMSKIFFDELGIKKEKYNLGINGGSHSEMTAEMMVELEKIILKEKPDLVVVFGDTNSTLAGAIVTSKLNIPLAHIEAGFRSHNRKMPEEINRIVTDHLSTFLFCPTPQSVKELKNEGIIKNVFFTGDIMYDATVYFSKASESKKEEIFKKLNLSEHEYLYCTIHRQANTESKDKLKSIFDALIESKEKIILPLHPRTYKKLKEFNLYAELLNKNIEFIEPISYFESLMLTKYCKKAVTDSGGVLREAYFFKKPCIVLRDSIEFKESLGESILVGSNPEKILKNIKCFEGNGKFPSFFGNGNSAKKIVEILLKNI